METTSTESKRAEQRRISNTVTRYLCEDKAAERLEAQRAVQRAEEDFRGAHTRIVNRAADTEADLKAHMDYLKPRGPVSLGEMSREDYDAEHRELEAAARAAKADLERIGELLAPYRKAYQDADKHVQDLTRQWNRHAQRAAENGVDISDLWTPDKPMPPAPAEAKP